MPSCAYVSVGRLWAVAGDPAGTGGGLVVVVEVRELVPNRGTTTIHSSEAGWPDLATFMHVRAFVQTAPLLCTVSSQLDRYSHLSLDISVPISSGVRLVCAV